MVIWSNLNVLVRVRACHRNIYFLNKIEFNISRKIIFEELIHYI